MASSELSRLSAKVVIAENGVGRRETAKESERERERERRERGVKISTSFSMDAR